jgi:uncharacterized protein
MIVLLLFKKVLLILCSKSQTMNNLDPVVLFFLLGAIAGLAKSDLKVPESFYNVLSIYLLLAIGIKGGIELHHTGINAIIIPCIGAVTLGTVITLSIYVIGTKIFKFSGEDAAALAAHYGSVSAVTFAVVISFLKQHQVSYEGYMTVMLVMMEIPAIVVAIGIYIMKNRTTLSNPLKLAHEIFMGKSVLLLTGGLIIGVFIEVTGNRQMNIFFFDLFKGFLAIFMLEMGIVASANMSDLRKAGIKILVFGILMPLFSASIGILFGYMIGLSVGGTTILATMAASASYIAAPAAVRIAIPKANPSVYLTAALGITFPFNLIFGINIYHQLAKFFIH